MQVRQQQCTAIPATPHAQHIKAASKHNPAVLPLLLAVLQDTFGPPLGKKLLIFVDDVNMPRVDLYGTQQPIALLKLFVERKGFYDRGKELSWKNVKDVQMVGALGPPGGARNNLDPRFVSLFSVFEVQAPSNSNLRTIYQVGAGASTAQSETQQPPSIRNSW